jgi:hypothetical protein
MIEGGRTGVTNLMDVGPLRSIGNRVEFNGTVLGSQLVFGLDILIELDQLLGDGLAEQVDDDFAIILGDLMDLWLVVRLVVRLVDGNIGLAGIGILMRWHC